MSFDQQHEGLTNEHIVAVFASESAAEDAARELRTGKPGTIEVFSGEQLADAVDAMGDKGGPLRKIIRHVQDALSEENRILAQYEDEARNGRGIVAMQVDGADDAEEAKDALLGMGGYNIRYFSRLAVKDLSVETNPSTLAKAPSDW